MFLSGTVGGTVGKINNSFGATRGGIDVTGGTWTFTGANSYGSGPWTNNVNYESTGGTAISGASTILVMTKYWLWEPRQVRDREQCRLAQRRHAASER